MSHKGANGHAVNGTMQSHTVLSDSCSPTPECMSGHIPPLVDPLTPREREVLALLAREGLTNKELAERLVVAEGTIWKHLSHIYGKLGVKNRSQAITWVNEQRAVQSGNT